MSDNYSRDPDDLFGEQKVAIIEVSIRRNGSMSVAGAINDEAVALAMLDNARDTVKNYHAKRRMNGGGSVIIPANETGLLS